MKKQIIHLKRSRKYFCNGAHYAVASHSTTNPLIVTCKNCKTKIINYLTKRLFKKVRTEWRLR